MGNINYSYPSSLIDEVEPLLSTMNDKVLVGLQYMSNMNSYSILSPFELPQTLSQIQNICQSEGITPPQYVNIP